MLRYPALFLAAALGLALAFAGLAFAQDRTVTLREVDVRPVRAEIQYQPDGGCVFQGCAEVVGSGLEPRCTISLNRPVCGLAVLQTATERHGKRALGLGDGGL